MIPAILPALPAKTSLLSKTQTKHLSHKAQTAGRGAVVSSMFSHITWEPQRNNSSAWGCFMNYSSTPAISHPQDIFLLASADITKAEGSLTFPGWNGPSQRSSNPLYSEPAFNLGLWRRLHLAACNSRTLPSLDVYSIIWWKKPWLMDRSCVMGLQVPEQWKMPRWALLGSWLEGLAVSVWRWPEVQEIPQNHAMQKISCERFIEEGVVYAKGRLWAGLKKRVSRLWWCVLYKR